MRTFVMTVFLCLLACLSTVAADGAQDFWTLNVSSMPFEGIRIGGDISGVTNYRCFCTAEETVELIAPQIVTVGDRRYAFVEWQTGGGELYDPVLVLIMNNDKFVTATYEMLKHELHVNSTPLVSEIAGSHPGTTNYMLQLNDREPVTLLALPEAKNTEGIFDFVHWLMDDEVVEEKPRLDFEMEASHTVTAVYEQRMHLIAVESEGIDGVRVTGSLPGTTPYDGPAPAGKAVNLQVPESYLREGVTYLFQHWKVNDHLYPIGERAINFAACVDATATAAYAPKKHLLSVESMPFNPVEITGSHPGSTKYDVTCTDGDTVSLAAPEIVIHENKRWRFDKWVLNDIAQPEGRLDVQFTMTDNVNLRAEYEEVWHTLRVESTPMSVNISGTLTGYEEQHADGVDLWKSAPVFVWHEGTEYFFMRWSGVGLANYNNMHVWMDADRTIVAEYRPAPRTLTVQSDPIGGVRLEGDVDALTDCEIIAESGQTIIVRAPETVAEGERRYDFVDWSGEVNSPEPEVEIQMTGDIFLTAHYELRQHELHVNSEPVLDVEIISDIPELTPFSEPRGDMSTVSLKAPFEVVHQDTAYDFSHWRVGDAIRRLGETVLSIEMDDEYTVTAVYEERTPTLTVLSSPLPGVQIIGSHPGISQYAVPVERGQFVNLSASPDVNIDGTLYYFAFWMIDGNLMLPGMTNLSFIMQGDTTVMAIYDWRVPGDYNEDGKIDLKDLVFVRNRLELESDEKNFGAEDE